MTSRLKRKLNNLGVDTSSNKANENFCLIGTPLPPLEKSKDTGEFVPLWKQDVRDEKGRRRLHGAFTGGFSAGYFNTVGSKEGWAPSTFISSRAERAKKKEARPEDFMDEEDLAELRESRNLVDENEEMDFGGTEAELRRRSGVETEDDTVTSALSAAIAPPPQDSVGARILRKMGWRMGQGVGPRLTYEQRRAQDRAARAGLRVQQEDDEAEDDEAKKHLYPRRDTALLNVSRKDNSHGLGYVPGLGLHESLGTGDRREGPHIAAGFGLGALNDADDDDLDIYDGSLRPGRGGRVVYDAAEDEDAIVMGSSRKLQRNSGNRATQAASAIQTFHDGRPVLKGFVLSERPVSDDRWFPLPEVPHGWTPDPKGVWQKENEAPAKDKESAEPPKTRAEWKRSLFSADERGMMLGETPLPSQSRSVFDYMSQKDRERLERIRQSHSDSSHATTAPGPTSAEQPPPQPTAPGPPATDINIPDIHPSVAKAALSGFQPFQSDPAKHARYTAFLQHASSATSRDTPLAIGPLPGQRGEDFRRELADYAKAATVFKPLSGAMASRFQSAAVVEHGPTAVEGLHTPDQRGASAEAEAEAAEKAKAQIAQDPRMAAVRMGMYGPLTREVVAWQPARLLCKRFGVREPEIEGDAAGASMAPDTSATVPEPGASTALAEQPLAITDGSAAAEGGERTGPRNLANVGLGEDEDQGRDTLTYERPAMDVFKAIFASDDEDSDNENESEQNHGVDQGPGATAPATIAEDDVPGPLHALDSVSTMQAPGTNPSARAEPANEAVDLTTFRPTFVPRSERESRKDKAKDKDKDRDKKGKKKKAAKTLVSFDTEEEGLQVMPVAAKREKHRGKDGEKDGERKKKKRKEKKEEEEDDSMWVEAPAPEVVQHLDFKSVSPPEQEQPTTSAVAGPHRGRKRAIDFM